jgi:hypothetical protein
LFSFSGFIRETKNSFPSNYLKHWHPVPSLRVGIGFAKILEAVSKCQQEILLQYLAL